MSDQPSRIETIERRILDSDWTEARLRDAAELLAEVDASAELLASLRDYDRLRGGLGALPAAVADADADADTDTDVDAEVDAPAAGWESFTERLVATIPPSAIEKPDRQTPWLALVAALVIGVIGGVIGGGATAWRALADGSGSVIAKVETVKPRPADAVDLFRRVNDAFDDQVSWVATSAHSGGASDVGLRAPGVSPDRLLVLSLSLRAAGHDEVLTDVYIVPGETADLELPIGDGRTARYHLSTTADLPARVTIWTEVEGPELQLAIDKREAVLARG